MMYDAGLFFLCYQRDPREGFIKIYENMAKLDALNQFTTHTGSGLFACPGGVARRRVRRAEIVPIRVTSLRRPQLRSAKMSGSISHRPHFSRARRA